MPRRRFTFAECHGLDKHRAGSFEGGKGYPCRPARTVQRVYRPAAPGDEVCHATCAVDDGSEEWQPTLTHAAQSREPLGDLIEADGKAALQNGKIITRRLARPKKTTIGQQHGGCKVIGDVFA